MKKAKTSKVKPEKPLTYTIGRYGTKEQAAADAIDIMRPDVFNYRSAYFPNPIDYGVTVKIFDATPVKLKKPSSMLYPWGIKFSVTATGEKWDRWLANMDSRLRVIRAE